MSKIVHATLREHLHGYTSNVWCVFLHAAKNNNRNIQTSPLQINNFACLSTVLTSFGQVDSLTGRQTRYAANPCY